MTVVDLGCLDEAQLERLMALTLVAAAEHAPGWMPTLEHVRETIDEARGKHARVAVVDAEPVAWIAAAHDWGRIWEIHPLIVAREHQRRGIGRLLVQDVEARAAADGALTLLLSTSDMTNATSVSNVDPYAAPIDLAIAVTKPHPVAFWQRCGFRIVGITPDAEAAGQPSITLAKSLCR